MRNRRHIASLYRLLLIERVTTDGPTHSGGGPYVVGRLASYDLALDAMERRWPWLKKIRATEGG